MKFLKSNSKLILNISKSTKKNIHKYILIRKKEKNNSNNLLHNNKTLKFSKSTLYNIFFNWKNKMENNNILLRNYENLKWLNFFKSTLKIFFD